MLLATVLGVAATYGILKRCTTMNVQLHHLQRAFLHCALYNFAPLTLASLSMLICRDINGTNYLAADLAVECWTGGHQTAAIVALAVLLTVGVGLPCVCYYKAQQYVVAATGHRSTVRDNSEGIGSVLRPVCWDPLYRTTRPECWWWMVALMMLLWLRRLSGPSGSSINSWLQMVPRTVYLSTHKFQFCW